MTTRCAALYQNCHASTQCAGVTGPSSLSESVSDALSKILSADGLKHNAFTALLFGFKVQTEPIPPLPLSISSTSY